MIRAQNVSKRYEAAGPSAAAVQALDGVSITIDAGEAVALMGASGSGKSTLLHLLGGLDAPTAGSIEINGVGLHTLDDGALSKFRREKLGFVFQFFHLLPTLSVLENIMLPGRLSGKADTDLQSRAASLIDRVGLKGREGDSPDRLSGGQQQRVALARALINKPILLLADEPTGNLDSSNSASVMQLLADLVKETGVTLVMATHSEDAAKITKRIVRLRDGKIIAG